MPPANDPASGFASSSVRSTEPKSPGPHVPGAYPEDLESSGESGGKEYFGISEPAMAARKSANCLGGVDSSIASPNMSATNSSSTTSTAPSLILGVPPNTPDPSGLAAGQHPTESSLALSGHAFRPTASTSSSFSAPSGEVHLQDAGYAPLGSTPSLGARLHTEDLDEMEFASPTATFSPVMSGPIAADASPRAGAAALRTDVAHLAAMAAISPPFTPIPPVTHAGSYFHVAVPPASVPEAVSGNDASARGSSIHLTLPAAHGLHLLLKHEGAHEKGHTEDEDRQRAEFHAHSRSPVGEHAAVTRTGSNGHRDAQDRQSAEKSEPGRSGVQDENQAHAAAREQTGGGKHGFGGKSRFVQRVKEKIKLHGHGHGHHGDGQEAH